MRLQIAVLFAAVAALSGCAKAAAPAAPKTDDEKALYALGVIMSRNVTTFEFTDQELAMVSSGLADGARNKAALDDTAIQALIPKLQELQTKRIATATTREKANGAAYLTKAAAEKDAKKTASGLVYKATTVGTGATPKPEDTVKVHYEGKFTDGKVFDSSRERNEPATFPLNGVIPCWTEAVQLMKVGGKAHVTCPPELAYGDEGRPPQMRGGATLVFDIELLGIVDPATAAAEAAAAAAAAGAGPAHPAIK
ncbi:MAG: FKBP-type peptidyl-prolyl cis-trans isomerase [Pseudomonadota bacterium]